MIDTLIDWQIGKAEKELGVAAPEMRFVARVSRRALRAFGSVRSWAHFREAVPAQVLYIAKIAAYRQEDCGSCMQITVNLCKKEGVPSRLIHAALERNLDELGPELRLVYIFAERQANRQDDPEGRAAIREKYGDKGLIDLAFAIVGSRTFPTFKRVLGYATSCHEVKLHV